MAGLALDQEALVSLSRLEEACVTGTWRQVMHWFEKHVRLQCAVQLRRELRRTILDDVSTGIAAEPATEEVAP